MKKKWSMWGSNSRPSRYQHDALPTELMDQLRNQANEHYFICNTLETSSGRETINTVLRFPLSSSIAFLSLLVIT